MRGQQFSGVRI